MYTTKYCWKYEKWRLTFPSYLILNRFFKALEYLRSVFDWRTFTDPLTDFKKLGLIYFFILYLTDLMPKGIYLSVTHSQTLGFSHVSWMRVKTYKFTSPDPEKQFVDQTKSREFTEIEFSTVVGCRLHSSRANVQSN